MANKPGAFFRVPGQKVTTPGDYEALPSQPDGLARPMPFAPGNDIDFQVTSITEAYKRLMSMQVPYYKISATNSTTNIYGESTSKWYYQPVLIKCYIDRGDESQVIEDYGVSNTQKSQFWFVHEMMQRMIWLFFFLKFLIQCIPYAADNITIHQFCQVQCHKHQHYQILS